MIFGMAGYALGSAPEVLPGRPVSGGFARRVARAVGGLPGSIRVRLAVLVLIVAVPLSLLSATLVWQNYQLALGHSAQTALQLRESVVARYGAAVGGAEQMLQALSQMDELFTGSREACGTRLAEILALQNARYTDLAVFEAGGQLRCSGSNYSTLTPDRVDRPERLLAAQADGFGIGSAFRGRAQGWIIPLVYQVRLQGHLRGMLSIGMRLDGFTETPGLLAPRLKAAWLAGPKGELMQLGTTGPGGLPEAATLQNLLSVDSVSSAPSYDHSAYAYASADVGAGYRILVGYEASADRQGAHRLLLKRIVQLASLMALGLAAVAVGAHVALVEPLHQLARAVARWRAGEGFDTSRIDDPPTEIRELAVTFEQATRALAEHEVKQRAALDQQDLLMKEIHHRVKNNLQIVASLLNLQASRIRAPEAKAEFASARDRVRALATLHRHLYSEGEMHSINMRSFLTELCGQLFQAMGEREGHRIQLSIEATELQMSSDQAVPLSLIVTEAVSNALKYAFPNGRQGHVDVRLTADADMAELMIRDDGVGIPAGRAETEMGPRDGIGLTLIRGFARQLGGDLSIEEGGGTLYRLRISLSAAHDVAEAAA